ncbi:MAG TPA: hypothetical protein VHC49_24785, partial [Mycobacteriales bacterium]|nr:hypothetical protein [Mycobacteriales bacterium]
FTSAGVAQCPLPPPGTRATVAVHHAEAVSWLQQHDGRFAVALVDPMFDRPRRAHPTFDLVRRHACHEPLTDRLLDAVLAKADRVVVRVGHPSTVERLARAPIRTLRSGTTFWAVFAGR